jgi:hypothetical protein
MAEAIDLRHGVDSPIEPEIIELARAIARGLAREHHAAEANASRVKTKVASWEA